MNIATMNLDKKNKKNKAVTKKLNARFKKHEEVTAALVHNDDERIRDLINKKIVSLLYKNTNKRVDKNYVRNKKQRSF